MPKVIENLDNKILKYAKIELKNKGYIDFNTRSVATLCKIAIGTMYNYYKSKDELICKIILDDWQEYLIEIDRDIKSNDDIYNSLELVFNDLVDFVLKYENIFKEKNTIEERTSICLDLQIIVSNLLNSSGYHISNFEESFIAEAFFYYAVKRDFSYDKLDNVIHKIIEKN